MDEKAVEAREQVEALVMEQHYDSARQKLLQMRDLYPSKLDQIGSMLTLCEVLSAAKLSLGGYGVDHYWVLNASPWHKLSHIRTRYHHILDSLRPLKSKFPAAELALELVERAFSVVSDRKKRSRFDSDRNGIWECLDEKQSSQDYFDFQREREPSRVEEGQIWAANFGTSGLPHRRYGRVSFGSNRVVCVTWLRPIPISASERSWCESGLPVSCGTFELGPESTTELNWAAVSSYNCDWVRGVLDGQFEIYPRRGEVWAIYKDWDIGDWAYRSDAVKRCKFELVEIASDFSKYTGVDCAYLVKVGGFRFIFERDTTQETTHVWPSMFYMFSHKVPAFRFTGGEIDGVAEGMFELDRVALPREIDGVALREITTPHMKSLNNLSLSEPYVEDCFSKPRWSAKDFGVGQIWAVCCGKDLMPRQYARIDRVVTDFQVCVTLLEPFITHDAESEWKKESLPIVSGVFKVSTISLEIHVSRFSYAVNCRVMSDPFYEIHPMKGEIWAVYKKWNDKWKQCDHQAYKCLVVQILSDMSEGDGTKIARLEVVKGCLTFFQNQQCDRFELTNRISITEALSFSHRIPAFRVPGIARNGIPESTWHLEPNALPPIRRVQFQAKPCSA